MNNLSVLVAELLTCFSVENKYCIEPEHLSFCGEQTCEKIACLSGAFLSICLTFLHYSLIFFLLFFSRIRMFSVCFIRYMTTIIIQMIIMAPITAYLDTEGLFGLLFNPQFENSHKSLTVIGTGLYGQCFPSDLDVL